MFIDGFASISSTLTTLTQKNVKFEWSETFGKNILMLNDRLTSSLVLTLPKGTKGFVLYYDSFRFGWGVFLGKMAKI